MACSHSSDCRWLALIALITEACSHSSDNRGLLSDNRGLLSWAPVRQVRGARADRDRLTPPPNTRRCAAREWTKRHALSRGLGSPWLGGPAPHPTLAAAAHTSGGGGRARGAGGRDGWVGPWGGTGWVGAWGGTKGEGAQTEALAAAWLAVLQVRHGGGGGGERWRGGGPGVPLLPLLRGWRAVMASVNGSASHKGKA